MGVGRGEGRGSTFTANYFSTSSSAASTHGRGRSAPPPRSRTPLASDSLFGANALPPVLKAHGRWQMEDGRFTYTFSLYSIIAGTSTFWKSSMHTRSEMDC